MPHGAIADEPHTPPASQQEAASDHAPAYARAVNRLYALGQELAPLPPLPDGTPAPRRKWDLAHMRTLCAALGDPQSRFPSILIAGTNGKGSTAATLASILAAAGYNTGLYTSPHLIRVNERIQVLLAAPASSGPTETSNPVIAPLSPAMIGHEKAGSTEISDPAFARLFSLIEQTAADLVVSGTLPHPPSFFEVLTALAFLHFAEQMVDIAVLEVGLGGRLDATNVIDPLISVITDIGLDHQEYLGTTIAAITAEKAGILRPNGILVTLPQHPEANQAIGEAAATLNLTAISAADFIPQQLNLGHSNRIADPTPQPGNFDPTPEPRNLQPITEPRVPHLRDSTTVAKVGLRAPHEPPSTTQPNPIPSSPEETDLTTVTKVGLRAPHEPLPRNHYTLTLDNHPLEVDSPLPGHHQQRNLALAIATATTLRNQKGYTISNSAMESGIRNTHWPGRLEFLPPNLLLDVAHNPDGAWTLRAAIAQLPESQPRTLIFSCLSDKDLTAISRILFPLFDSSPEGDRHHDHIVFAPIANPRAANVADLLAAAHALDIPAHAAPHLAGALAQARAITPPGGLIIATGSVYLVGAIRELALENLPA